jgi:hypothetical protein
MKPSTLVGATLMGFVLVGIAPHTSTHAQQRRAARRTSRATQPAAQPTAPRICVGFSQERASDGRSISMALTNRCDQDVESTISWRLTCGDSAEGSSIERVEHMTPHENKLVVANVDACGSSSYRIDNIRWNWRFAPQ